MSTPNENTLDIEQIATEPNPIAGQKLAKDLNGFWERQAKRVARNPCTYFWTFLLLGIALSCVGMIVGEFSVSANTGGWQSRGTLIANRQTQLMLVELNQAKLFYGGEQAWSDLLVNVQPGWEDYGDDSERRRLDKNTPFAETEAKTLLDYFYPIADQIDLAKQNRQLPFQMTPDLHRKLEEQFGENCFSQWYAGGNMTQETHLWPVWKTSKDTNSALDPEIIRDICVAESNTQRLLEEKGLCFGCDEGCLPPFSLVLYARLLVPNGFDLDCDQLSQAWAPFQQETESGFQYCVKGIKAKYNPNGYVLPISCMFFNLMSTLVEESFDSTLTTRYTSSIFATNYSIDDLYEEVDNFDRGSELVQAAYDTQYEDFVGLYLEESLSSDMALALGSAVIVALAILLHTRSPFITIIGLTQIILSFPLSYFFYKLVLGLNFFPFLNFIGIFVVFALGAGDVFVAIDKWKNARLEYPQADTEYIAAVSLPDAAVAMFLTTLTTAIAFFSTAICPVAPVKMFAIFCGLLILFDYIMNVLLIFPALCIYDKALSKDPKKVNCCITCTCCGLLVPHGDSDDNDEGDQQAQTKKQDLKPSLIRSIFLGFYYVLHYLRWPLFFISLVALAVCIYYATTLTLPTSSDVRLLDEKSQFEQSYQWRQKLLSTALDKTGGSQAYVIWGVKPADTGDQNDPGTWSQLVLDESFDPSSESAQIFLLDFCDDLFDQDFAETVGADYLCPMKRFHEWLQEQSVALEPDPVYTEYCNQVTGIPVPQEQFHSCIIAWSQQVEEETSILVRNDKVTVLFIPFTSRVRYDDNYDTLDDEWNMIEQWMKEQNRNAPNGVNLGYFSSFDFWWYDTNGQMLQTAYSAAGITLLAAAVVILFSSRSLVLTLFSTLTIGYVLTSVTATLVAMGWTLGFLESICFAILIGVSVDFVIHLSHAYATLPGTVSRSQRTKYALIKMGPSILATAVTTILSAVVMLFTVITFFQKFALILFFTIIQATLGTFLVFVTMVDCVGPTNPTYFVDRLFGVHQRTEAKLEKEESEETITAGDKSEFNSSRADAQVDNDDDDDEDDDSSYEE